MKDSLWTTRVARLVVVTLLFLLAMAPTRAFADEPAQASGSPGTETQRALVLEMMKKEPRIALVIGNGGYSVGPLKNPPSDARLMKATLDRLNFDTTLLIDASQQDMKRAIIEFGKKLEELGDEKGGIAFFYYAGHGLQINGKNYLVPVAAHITTVDDVEVEAVDVDAVLNKLSDSKSRLNVVVLDACRNNPFRSAKRAVPSGLAQPSGNARGTVIAYATGPGSVAEDGGGANSTYTQALSEAMLEPGLELNEVFQAVREKVLASTDKRQTPWESSSKTGQFFFQPGTVPTGRIFGSIGGMKQQPVGLSLELDAALALGMVTGGDGCTGSCNAGLPIGFAGVVHGDYNLGSGLGFGLHAGYLLTSRTLKDRPLTLTARGRDPSTSTIEESQRLGGFLIGGEALYHTAGDWPFMGRVGAGILVGSLSDKRTGTFKDSTQANFDVNTSQTPGALYLYLAPEARLGRKLGEHFEVSVGLTVMVLAGLNVPKWDSSKTVPVGADGIASPPADKLLGGLMLVGAPSIGARYQF